MAKKQLNLKYGKKGQLIWLGDDGKLVRGLRRKHFVAKNAEKERVSEFYEYLSEVYKIKAIEALEVMTSEEKIDAQIAKLMKKKEGLKK